MQNKVFKILIVGPQGSGKGTQGQKVAKQLNIPYYSTGNILRKIIQKPSPFGKQASEYMNSGQLVPDDLMKNIVKETIHYSSNKHGYLLDGYPRNLNQAIFFDTIDQFTHVILIKLHDQESLRRNMNRRTCQDCQASYHLEYNPPQKSGICDKCGGKLIIRADEQEETLKRRLVTYHQITEPIIDYYRDKGVLIEIDGEQSIEKVYQDILNKLLMFDC